MSQNRLILYIDDDTASQGLVREIIAQHNRYQIQTAETLTGGLNACGDVLPDLILLDMNLSGVSGYDIIKDVRQYPGFGQTPVIAVSGDALQEDIDKALAAGFTDYITKPIFIDKFIATLERFLDEA